jgi:hypothetical protein
MLKAKDSKVTKANSAPKKAAEAKAPEKKPLATPMINKGSSPKIKRVDH